MGHHDHGAEPAGRPRVPRAATRSCSRSAPAGPLRRRPSSPRATTSAPCCPSIQARTLVLGPADTPFGVDRARFLAELIPHSDLATFPGTDMMETARCGRRSSRSSSPAHHRTPVSDRVLATVLFTDIVSSTDHLADDRRPGVAGAARPARRNGARRAWPTSAAARSTPPATASSWSSTARHAPIRCAEAVVDGARGLGIEVRAGVHTGECEVRGDGYAGIAVHTGARIAALAGGGEVLASRTVKDLIAGSGIELEDHGVHELKGIPEPWQVYQGRRSAGSRNAVPRVERGGRVHGGHGEAVTARLGRRARRPASRAPARGGGRSAPAGPR